MCRGLRQRRHGDPEHPDRRRGHLSRSSPSPSTWCSPDSLPAPHSKPPTSKLNLK
uniref:Uncharacterized protein n=1 Tax=Anguilla anguilla TaxID=7936 RepID=A0A0E9SBD9_ANGAN